MGSISMLLASFGCNICVFVYLCIFVFLNFCFSVFIAPADLEPGKKAFIRSRPLTYWVSIQSCALAAMVAVESVLLSTL